MKAVVTGGSSGIGYSIAKYLESQDIDLIIISSDKDKLEKVRPNFKPNTKFIVADLTDLKKVKDTYVILKQENVDILINNAGFGLLGEFTETDINEELDMINLNVKAVHVLTKLILKDMQKKNFGYILNVSSCAAFGPGPLMATYYASKAYVETLTESIHEELRRNNSNVVISCLCPGPVNTNFNNRAGVKKFGVKALEPDYVAKYAIDKMYKGKLIIIPGFTIKLATFMRRFVPRSLIRRITYNLQDQKRI